MGTYVRERETLANRGLPFKATATTRFVKDATHTAGEMH